MKLKRILALTLALILAAGLIPAQALATEPTTEPTVVTEPPATTAPKETEPSVPATTQQETEQPTESAPETSVPETSVPESSEPETSEPETSVPETTVPEETTFEIPMEDETVQLTADELYKAIFQETTLRGLFNLVNENVDGLIGFSVSQISGFEKLISSIKKSTTMTQDEEEALTELLSNVETLKEMHGVCSVCGIDDGGHISTCVYFGDTTSTFSIPAANPREVSGDLHYSKELVTDDAGNIAIQMEAWTEGNAVAVPTEIVVVLDHSASVYSPVDKTKIWKYNEFLKKADKEKGANFAGYYVVINKFKDGDATDLSGDDIKVGEYCYALVRYNKSREQWERFHVKKFSKGEYDNRRINSSFFDNAPMRTQSELLALTDENGNKYGWYALDSRDFDGEDAYFFESIYGATVDALTEFVTIVKDIPSCRIAFTGFAGHGSYGTGIFSATTQKLDPGTNPNNAFFNSSNSTALTNIINNYIPHFGSTSTQDGLAKANDIFKASGQTGKVNRTVMLFTDGIPSHYDADKYPNTGAFLAALLEAYEVKNTTKATLYSVGPAQAVSDATGNEVYFMDYISSNYPGAKSLDNPGTKERSDCNIIASNGPDLVAAFKKLGEMIFNASKALNANAEVRDTVTPYFDIGGDYDGGNITVWKIPNVKNAVTNVVGFDESQKVQLYGNGKNDVTVTIKPYEYEHVDLEGQLADTVGNQVVVTGFDYQLNSVFTNTGGGAKMRIIIPIKPADNFLGGNAVPTNGPGSGIYDKDGNQVEKFPVPEIDVATSASANISADVNVYLGSVFAEKTGTDGQKHYGLGVSDLHGVISGGYNNVLLDFTKPAYGLDPAMDDYVTVELDIFQPIDWHLESDINTIRWSEVPVVTMDEVLWDTPYKLRITITPKNADGDCKTVFAEDIGWIHVFYPEITFHDVKSSYYGETAESEQIKAAVEGANQSDITIDWINQSREGAIIYDDAVTMTMPADGKIPEVKFSYSIPVGMSSLPKTDVPVEVLVEQIGYVGQKNAGRVNQYVNFKWDACSPACEQNIAEHHGIAASPEFYIHPNTCRLTVTKTGGAGDEPYVFTVLKDGKAYTEISITGNGSHTIYELPVGTYSIQEATDWTWRYDATDYDPDSVALSRTNDKGAITCNNTLKNIYWLNDFSEVYRNVFGIPKT